MKKIFLIILTLISTLSFASQSHATDFFETKILNVKTELPNTVDIDVCVGDFAKHRDIVSGYVSRYFNGNVKKLDYSSYSIYKDEKCDVINHSMGVYPVLHGSNKYENQKEFNDYIEYESKKIDEFLKYHKGIIVESAGNDGEDTKISSSIARYKSKNKNEEVDERLFVVGQIQMTKNGDYIHHFNYGDEVDFVVANYGEYMEDGHYAGTSFSAPVVSGVIATLLSAGIPQEDIRDVIGYEDKVHVYKGKEYKVFSYIKTFGNAYKYINNKAIDKSKK